MEPITINHVTLGDDVAIDGKFFVIEYWDARFVRLNERGTKLYILKDVVRDEAIKRDKLRGWLGYYSQDEYKEETISFETWIEDYPDESDQFIQDLACEMLNLNLIEDLKQAHNTIQGYMFQTENLKSEISVLKSELDFYKALAEPSTQIVVFQSKINEDFTNNQHCKQGKKYLKQA